MRKIICVTVVAIGLLLAATSWFTDIIPMELGLLFSSILIISFIHTKRIALRILITGGILLTLSFIDISSLEALHYSKYGFLYGLIWLIVGACVSLIALETNEYFCSSCHVHLGSNCLLYTSDAADD